LSFSTLFSPFAKVLGTPLLYSLVVFLRLIKFPSFEGTECRFLEEYSVSPVDP